MGKIVLFSSLLIVAILSFSISSFEFILLGILMLSLVFLLLVGIFHIFRKTNYKFIKIPSLLTGICLFGIGVSLFRPYEEQAIVESGSVSDKLEYAYETDQKDRKQLKSYLGFSTDFEKRDQQRLEQVEAIYNSEESLEPMEKFYAAFVYHHGRDSMDYEIAQNLAAQAAESEQLKSNYQAQWLRKASYDRYMLSLGKPEKYHTQNKISFEAE